MRLSHVTKYAVTVGAVVAPMVICPPTSYASTNATGSAFALAATGLVPISPVSVVPATSAQQETRKSLAELPANPMAAASILSAAASAGHGRASVADLKLYKAGLEASVIGAKCENGNGSAHLVKAVLNGRELAVRPSANTTVAVPSGKVGAAAPQILKVILNKQVHNPDGTLTVTAIELSLSLGTGKTETISIASATCGSSTSNTGPSEGGSAGAAPAPTPVSGDLPVTG